MAISIADVAHRANVSITTVSRVINGRKVVNIETRKRVEAAIAELGYRPNAFARGLMLKKSSILELVLPDMHGEFYSEVIRGANTQARASGYHLLVSSVTTDTDSEALLSNLGGQTIADGFAIMVSELDAPTREFLAQTSLPVVVIEDDATQTKHDTVAVDQRCGALALMRHVVSTNVDRVIFLGAGTSNIDSNQRYEAYRDVMADANLSVGREDVFHLDFCYESAYKLAQQQLRAWRGASTCVFAANDEMAAGVIHAAQANGLSLPQDLKVVGFDDTRMAQFIQPALTTVHVPIFEMGATAIRMLIDRLANPQNPQAQITLQSRLVVRDSCR